MKIDDKKFEALKNKQEQEKNQALAEIYSEEAFERSPGNAKAIEERSIAHEEIRQVSTATRQENEIWSVDDLAPKNVTTQKEIEKITPVREVRNNEPLPNIRQVNMEEAVQIPFTERLFAHLPMRESQLKEAPHPRLRELAKKIGPENAENLKSPVWFKNKGDDFMQAEDYLAAISAYETAIKLDVTYWAAHSNLIVCHLKLFNIDECLKGCGYLLEKFIGLQKNNQMTAMTERIRAKIFLRQLCCLAYKGELKNFREAGGYLINEPSIEAVYKERLAEDMKTVEQREELLTKKVVFDGLLKSGNNVDAKIGYESLLSDYGPNERIYSNLSLCQVMQGKFEEATQTASDGLNLVEKHLNKNFGQSEQHKQNDFFKQMKIKFFYKRAQAHSGLNEVEKAEKDLGSVLVLDDRNEEARTMKRKIARKRDYEEGMRLKKSGDEAVQLEKPSEALGFYRQCLEKLTVSENLMEYLAVLSNMTVCQGRLEQTDEVISTCMKGLRVTSKHSKSTIMLEGDKLRSEDLEKLLQMELRFHIRKGNAFLKNGQIYHAKAAFEEAIKLAPDNQEIKQGLAKASFL